MRLSSGNESVAHRQARLMTASNALTVRGIVTIWKGIGGLQSTSYNANFMSWYSLSTTPPSLKTCSRELHTALRTDLLTDLSEYTDQSPATSLESDTAKAYEWGLGA